MKLEELYSKYHIISDGLQRRYIQAVNERRYDLDYVTPIELVILVDRNWEEDNGDLIISPSVVNKRFESRSWVQLLKEMVTYLQNKSPKSKEELLAYRTDWSKAPIFSDSKSIDNMVEIENELFFSVNYTATHSTWIIGDLLEFYGISVGYLVLHRTPISEPKEVREEVGKVRREEFKDYLIAFKGKDEEKASKIVKNFDALNKVLAKMGTSYNDFFLFDDTLALSNYKSRMLKDYPKYIQWNESQVKTVQRYLDYITHYYTKAMKEAKKHKEDLEFFIPTL